MTSKKTTKNAYRAYLFGYNGKELENEIKGTGNTYDYGARFYDAQLGRWHVPDPMSEKHPNYSGYAYVYNNPIKLIDPFGLDTIFANNQSKIIFDNTYKAVEDGINSLNNRKNKTINKLKTKSKSKRLNNKLNRLNKKIAGLNAVKDVLDFAITSDMVFYYDFYPANEFVKSGGSSTWNYKENRYDIIFVNGNKAGGTISHETRHGKGYAEGEFGFIENLLTGKAEYVDYGYKDELEAFKIGSYFTKYTKRVSTLVNEKRLKRMIKANYKNKPNIIKHF